MPLTEFELVCIDENGGIARTSSGAFEEVHAALDAAVARGLGDCERVVVFEAETGSVVWRGTRAAAVKAASHGLEHAPAVLIE